MNEELETNKNYAKLDGEDDVLLLGKATFTVRRFKELVARKFDYILLSIEAAENESRKKAIYYWMQSLSINEETTIPAGDINWSSPQEGIDCQILIIGAKGWQKGKLKIEVNRSFQSGKTQTSIKFCPDLPNEPISPLDDIRQSEEYKKLSNNN
ncbi:MULTISPECIES: KGK domain-containing protein [Microcoleaceae]|uniref:KGK domain-containing protein n=1 Tax=Microcoleaceae TaxID=1892252 RepID=UPI001880944D|nr:KGK domain-containing protein [Tychonema sp. LEGE 06208]MBE9164534.1 KGK family protein [Tychonema sp. LEGE 06208]